MAEKVSMKQNNMKYFDDLSLEDRSRVEQLLSSNYLNKLIHFRNANGNNLTCLPYKSEDLDCLVILDKKASFKKEIRSSYRFDPLSDMFNLDEFE
jgi:hypothetical protein